LRSFRVGRRQLEIIPRIFRTDPGCCGRQNRQDYLSHSKTTSVRGARCCGSAPGGCGLVATAAASQDRRCTAGARGGGGAGQLDGTLVFCYTAWVEKCVQKAGDSSRFFYFRPRPGRLPHSGQIAKRRTLRRLRCRCSARFLKRALAISATPERLRPCLRRQARPPHSKRVRVRACSLTSRAEEGSSLSPCPTNSRS
jgi:hypothetical protein